MCENLDVDLEAIAFVHSLQYSTLSKIVRPGWPALRQQQSLAVAHGRHRRSKLVAIIDHEPAIDPATHLGEGRQGALDSPGAHLP